MSELEKALALDEQGKVADAAQAYEEAIRTGNAPLDAFLGLAFVYWQCTDFGFNAAHHLDPAFVAKAGKRYREVLAEARARFGDLPELAFWRAYFDFVELGEPPDDDEMERLLAMTDAPALYLYQGARDARYLPSVERLLEAARRRPTIKNNYIRSVLESVLRSGPPPS